MYLGRIVLMFVALFFACGLGATSATAQVDQAPVTISSTQPKAEPDGDSYKVSAQFNNLTKQPLTLQFRPTTGATCDVEPASADLRRSESKSVAVTLDSGCKEPFGFDVTVREAGTSEALDTISVQPEKAESETKVDWGKLKLGYILALVIAFAAGAGVYKGWTKFRGKPKASWDLRTPLEYNIKDDWSISGSWLTNVTALGAAAAAVYGANIAPTFLGSESDDEIQLVLVAAVISAVLLAAGSTFVMATKSKCADELGNVKTVPSVGGVLFGAWLAAAGSLGLLLSMIFVVNEHGTAVKLWVGVPLVILVILVVIYCWRSLSELLRLGVTKPKTAKVKVGKGKRKLQGSISTQMETEGISEAIIYNVTDNLELPEEFEELAIASTPEPPSVNAII